MRRYPVRSTKRWFDPHLRSTVPVVRMAQSLRSSCVAGTRPAPALPRRRLTVATRPPRATLRWPRGSAGRPARRRSGASRSRAGRLHRTPGSLRHFCLQSSTAKATVVCHGSRQCTGGHTDHILRGSQYCQSNERVAAKASYADAVMSHASYQGQLHGIRQLQALHVESDLFLAGLCCRKREAYLP